MVDDHHPHDAADAEGWATLDDAAPVTSDGDLADPQLHDRLEVLASAAVPGDPTDRAFLAVSRGRARARRRLQVLLPVAAVLALVLFVVVARSGSDQAEVRTSTGGSNVGTTAPANPATATGTGTSTTTAKRSTIGIEPPSTTTTAGPPTTVPVTPPTTAVPITTTSPSPTSSTPGPTVPLDAVSAVIRPHASEVRVGERLLVDLIVHNTSAADITYVVGSSSCPDFGRAIAGLTDDPQGPTDWAGNPMVGSHASIKDLVATGNQLTNVWYLAPEADQDAMAESGQRACTADLRTDVIGAGASVSKTVAFDAAVAPGPLERTTITIDYVFEYWPDSAGAAIGDAATRQAATATTSVGLVDDPVRNERLADVYALIDADPRVREVLDASADQQYLVWAGYRHGVLRFRLLPFLMAPGSGGRLALLDVDPARVEIVSFSYPDP